MIICSKKIRNFADNISTKIHRMRKYILHQADTEINITDKQGNEVLITDLLTSFPENRVFAFYGQMGAGKTTFIKQLCLSMGTNDIVNSPTFAIVNVYEDKAKNEIYHFDCYRLKNLQEAIDMGTDEYLYSGNYCFIEWPEMIEELLPEDTIKIRLSIIDGQTRIMEAGI